MANTEELILSKGEKKRRAAAKFNSELPSYCGLSQKEGAKAWWLSKMESLDKEFQKIDAGKQELLKTFSEMKQPVTDAQMKGIDQMVEFDKKSALRSFRKKYGNNKYLPH